MIFAGAPGPRGPRFAVNLRSLGLEQLAEGYAKALKNAARLLDLESQLVGHPHSSEANFDMYVEQIKIKREKYIYVDFDPAMLLPMPVPSTHEAMSK